MNCPKCKSTDWKSAELVVLEGISSSSSETNGNVDGSMTEKGIFSLNPRDWLLADRWFNYSHPIELNLNSETKTETITGLAHKIKELMVQAGDKMPMPKEPELKKIPKVPVDPRSGVSGFFRKSMAKNHTESKLKELSNKPLSVREIKARSYFLFIFYTFCSMMAFSGLGGFIWIKYFDAIPIVNSLSAMFEFPERVASYSSQITFIALIISVSLVLLLPSLFKYKKYLKTIDKINADRRDKAESKRQKQVETLEKQSAFTDGNQASLNASVREYEHDLVEYEIHSKESNLYNMRVQEEFEATVAEVKLFRNELWDRARVCQRCGTAYLNEI
jgi:hypothetical protein